MKERHLLTEIDEEHLFAFCSVCDTLVKIKTTGTKKPDGSTYWRCKRSYKESTARTQHPHRLYKKEACEECGFFAKNPAQLHVDHIDGNKKNNDPSNFQTLCANCHAYKTAMNQDWMSNKFSQPTA